MSDLIGRLFLWGSIIGSIVAGWRLIVVCIDLHKRQPITKRG